MTKSLKESPFFEFVSDLKKIIEEFPKKYPIHLESYYQEKSDYELIVNGSIFVDRIYSFMILFDKQSSPSQLSIGSNILPIKKYLDKTSRNYKDIFNQDIKTQLFYDFTLSFVKLINTLPDSLAEFIPFFDYKALHTSDFIRKFFNAVNFPSIKPKEGEAFVYEFIRNKNTTLIDGGQEYKQRIQDIKNKLQTKLNTIHTNVDFVIQSFEKVKKALMAEVQSHLNSVRLTLASYEEVCLAERGGNTLEKLMESTQSQLERLVTTKAVFQEKLSNCGFFPDASRKEVETKLDELISSQIIPLNDVLRDLDHKLKIEFEFHRDKNLNFCQALNDIQAEAEYLITQDQSENLREAMKGIQDAEQHIIRLRNKLNQINNQLCTFNQSSVVSGENKKIATCYETSLVLVNTTSHILDKNQNLFVERKNNLQEQFARVNAEEKLAKLVKSLAQDKLKMSLDEEQEALNQLSNAQLSIGDQFTLYEGERNRLHSTKLTLKTNLIVRFQAIFTPLAKILSTLNDQPNFAISDLTEIESCKSALNWLEDFIQRWFTLLEGEKEYGDKINRRNIELHDLILAKRCLVDNQSEIPLSKINELKIFKKGNNNASSFDNLLEFLHIQGSKREKYFQKRSYIGVLGNLLKPKEKSRDILKHRNYLLSKLEERIVVTNSSIELCEEQIYLLKIFKTSKEHFNEARLSLTTLYNQLQSEQIALEREEAELAYKIQAIEAAQLNAMKEIAEKKVKVAALQKIECLVKLNEKINGWKQIDEKQKLSSLISLRSELATQIEKKEDYGHSSVNIDTLQERLINTMEENGYDFFVSKIFPPIKASINAIEEILLSHNPEQIPCLCDKLDDSIQKLVKLKESVDKTDNNKIQSSFNDYFERTEYLLSDFLSKYRFFLDDSLTPLVRINSKFGNASNSPDSITSDLKEIYTTIDFDGLYLLSKCCVRLSDFLQNINYFFVKKNTNIAAQIPIILSELANFHRQEQLLLDHKKRIEKENDKISHRKEVSSTFN